jgi:hypothetical protein
MTFTNQTNRTSAVGNAGVGQVVPFAFPISDNSDITVLERVTATGVETTLTETTNYTVTNNGASGGSITTVTAVAATSEIHIVRDTPNTQELDLTQGGTFNAENIEAALDKNTKLTIENTDTLTRTMRIPPTDATSINMELPSSVDRNGKYLTFDANGEPAVTETVAAGSVTFSAFGETLVDDANAAAARTTLVLGPTDPLTIGVVTADGLITKTPCVDVTHPDYGAKGDGSTDDAAAFTSALSDATGGVLFVPNSAGAYIIKSQLTIPTNTIIVGQTRHVTEIQKQFNGDLFVVGENAGLRNLYLDGDGGNYTGKCMLFTGTDGRQCIAGVKATDWDLAVVDIATAAASQSNFIDCIFERTASGTGTARYAVVIDSTQQLTAKPRKFSHIETGGNCSFDFGGSNNTFVVNSVIGDVKYTAESRSVLISNSRILNQATLTIDGDNNTIVGCNISPAMTIAASVNEIAIQCNSLNNPPIIDNSGNDAVMLDYGISAYTPSITSGGSAPSLGNGTITGFATRTGMLVNVTINLTLGSTTSLGSGALRFSLPTFAPNTSAAVQYCGDAVLYDDDAAIFYRAAVQLPAATDYVTLIRDTSGSITFNDPVTWATSDTFRISFTYQAS